MNRNDVIAKLKKDMGGYKSHFNQLVTGVMGETIKSDFYVGKTPHLVRIQEVSGTTYQKIPCLLEGLLKYGRSVTLVLVGKAWSPTMKRFIENKTNGTNICVEFKTNA